VGRQHPSPYPSNRHLCLAVGVSTPSTFINHGYATASRGSAVELRSKLGYTLASRGFSAITELLVLSADVMLSRYLVQTFASPKFGGAFECHVKGRCVCLRTRVCCHGDAGCSLAQSADCNTVAIARSTRQRELKTCNAYEHTHIHALGTKQRNGQHGIGIIYIFQDMC